MPRPPSPTVTLFDCVKGRDAWRKKVRGHFNPNCPGMKPTLVSSESMGHETFDNDALVAEANTYLPLDDGG